MVVEHYSTALTDYAYLLLVTVFSLNHEPSEKLLPVSDHVLLHVADGRDLSFQHYLGLESEALSGF